MNRDDETAQITSSGDAEDAPAPGDPVGRVNLPDEPEPDAAHESDAFSDAGQSASPSAPRDQLREKVVFGLLTVVMMILAMIVILQGVFEQKMPV